MVQESLGVAGPVGIVHVHSSFSHDGRDTLEALRDVSRARGIGFVGLTDHAEDFDAALFGRYLGQCAALSTPQLLLIPGLEFRFVGYPGLHLLAFGLTRWIAPATPEEFVALTRDGCGLTMVAHPVLPDYRVPWEVRGAIDALEVWNAAYNTRYLPDPRAIRLLAEMRQSRPEIVGIAGLDQHDSRNDRETRVLLDRASDDPLAELRAGRFLNAGRTMRFSPHPDWGPGRLALLSTMRLGLDLVERTQERVVRAIRRARR